MFYVIEEVLVMICLYVCFDVVEWECCECREDVGGVGCNFGMIVFDEGIWLIVNGVVGDVVLFVLCGWRYDGW